MVEHILKKYRTLDNDGYPFIKDIDKNILEEVDSAFVHCRIQVKTHFTSRPTSYTIIIKFIVGVLHEVACWSFIEVVTNHIKSLPEYTWDIHKHVHSTMFINPAPSGWGNKIDESLKTPYLLSEYFFNISYRSWIFRIVGSATM